jgi:hypothetical protein
LSVFEELAQYGQIVVTGPQRSGTRIATQMIASDTGHRYVDEAKFGVRDVEAWLRALDGGNVVVQSPGLAKHIVDDPPPGHLRGPDATTSRRDPRQCETDRVG